MHGFLTIQKLMVCHTVMSFPESIIFLHTGLAPDPRIFLEILCSRFLCLPACDVQRKDKSDCHHLAASLSCLLLSRCDAPQARCMCTRLEPCTPRRDSLTRPLSVLISLSMHTMILVVFHRRPDISFLHCTCNCLHESFRTLNSSYTIKLTSS